jgi:hypothetical protein
VGNWPIDERPSLIRKKGKKITGRMQGLERRGVGWKRE